MLCTNVIVESEHSLKQFQYYGKFCWFAEVPLSKAPLLTPFHSTELALVAENLNFLQHFAANKLHVPGFLLAFFYK